MNTADLHDKISRRNSLHSRLSWPLEDLSTGSNALCGFVTATHHDRRLQAPRFSKAFTRKAIENLVFRAKKFCLINDYFCLVPPKPFSLLHGTSLTLRRISVAKIMTLPHLSFILFSN